MIELSEFTMEVKMILGMYPLEPGFACYDRPLTNFLVPGDAFDPASLDLIVNMLCKRDVDVRAEHDFSPEAADGEIEPDMHLLIFSPPNQLELICRSCWKNGSVRTFLWYAFGNEPIEIPLAVIKTWLKNGEMAFILSPVF